MIRTLQRLSTASGLPDKELFGFPVCTFTVFIRLHAVALEAGAMKPIQLPLQPPDAALIRPLIRLS